MNRTVELSLIEQCLAMYQSGDRPLASATRSSHVDRYTSQDRFDQEMQRIHRRMPIPWVHCSELPGPHTFRRMTTPLGSVLFTRDTEGRAHAFHNVCRHRGMALVNEDSGVSERLVCPYHAWSYSCDGELLNVPGEDSCFPNLDKTSRALAVIPCVEAYGFIWICPDAQGLDAEKNARQQLDVHLGDMAENLQWLEMEKLQRFEQHSRVWRANWKLLSEGGLETYHFKTAHRDTIGPYFLNDLSIQDRFGIHSRMVMPSQKIEAQADKNPDERYLRDFTHILFGVAPQSSFLVQEGHVDWIRMTPLGVDATEIAVTSLVPSKGAEFDEQARKHWATNMQITSTTLDEDFTIAERIQCGLHSGANRELLFGRSEGLLGAFNDWVEAQLID